jgi:hypothetical protein
LKAKTTRVFANNLTKKSRALLETPALTPIGCGDGVCGFAQGVAVSVWTVERSDELRIAIE